MGVFDDSMRHKKAVVLALPRHNNIDCRFEHKDAFLCKTSIVRRFGELEINEKTQQQFAIDA